MKFGWKKLRKCNGVKIQTRSMCGEADGEESPNIKIRDIVKKKCLSLI